MPDQQNPRVLIIENGDDWRALNVPEDWDLDDVDRYLNGMAYGRAAVLTVAEIVAEPSEEDAAEARLLRSLRDEANRAPVPDLMAALEASLSDVRVDREPSRDSFLPADGGEYGGGSM